MMLFCCHCYNSIHFRQEGCLYSPSYKRYLAGCEPASVLIMRTSVSMRERLGVDRAQRCNTKAYLATKNLRLGKTRIYYGQNHRHNVLWRCLGAARRQWVKCQFASFRPPYKKLLRFALGFILSPLVHSFLPV